MIRIACVIIILIVAVGCTHESQTITGQVVDESGAALNDVVVTACYSGWGWSSGYLVWDKNYCSQPVSTNSTGLYVINFKGPEFIRLRAKKDGWIQAQDFAPADSRITLTSSKDYSARATAEAKLREKIIRQRIPNETDTEYYCRVILSRSRPVTLQYKGERLAVTQSLFTYQNQNEALFALNGSATAARSFADEIQFKINGQRVNSKFSYRPVETTCKADIHFLGATIHDLQLLRDERLEILVPSHQAMFDMHVWNNSGEP